MQNRRCKKSSACFFSVYPIKKPRTARLGESTWESNPPKKLLTPHTGFEDQEAHQHPFAPMQEHHSAFMRFLSIEAISLKAVPKSKHLLFCGLLLFKEIIFSLFFGFSGQIRIFFYVFLNFSHAESQLNSLSVFCFFLYLWSGYAYFHFIFFISFFAVQTL